MNNDLFLLYVTKNKSNGGIHMTNLLKQNSVSIRVKLFSLLAALSMVILKTSTNQVCWYVLHEEKLPEGCEKFKKAK